MKYKIQDFVNKIKTLVKQNPIYLAIFIISIIILIIGSITIGFLKTLLFLILVDGILILSEYQNIKKRKKNIDTKEDTNENFIESNEEKITNNEETTEEINNTNQNRSSELMTNNKKNVSQKKIQNKKENKVTKETKEKKKIKAKKIIKIILIVCFVIGIAALIAMCLFFKMIVDEAPDFDVENLIMKESSIIYSSDNQEIGRLGNENREIITYDELPEILIDAIVATEDSRFFQHNGFDLPRFLKASLGQAAGNDNAGGASTLTMQIVKNAFTVQNKNTQEKSTGFSGIKRKFTDIYMAIFKLEKNYTKQELMEFYVNYSFLGSNSYGVEQASLTYFNKPAKDLNLSEAALIAGLYQSPGSYDPLKNEQCAERAEKRRITVLKLMERHGYITSEEREIAEKMTVSKIVVGTRPNENGDYRGFIDMIAEDVEEKTGWDPNTIPLKIESTMNKSYQDHINKIMTGETFVWENPAVQAGIAVIDVKTGAIVAIGSNRKNEAKIWNFATDEVRQIGSTAKPLYDYAPAIEYNNASTYGPVTDEPYTYTGGGEINNWDGGYQAFLTIREALRVSRNIPALKIFQSVKNSDIYEMATNLGLHPELENNYVHEAHSIGAYTGETPVSLAAAYAAFSNSGYYNEPYSFTKVTRLDTGEVYEIKTSSRKAMGADTAYMITNMLQDTATWALGKYSYVNGVKYAAKTGTTNFDDKQLAAKNLPGSAINDLWVAGYDSNYSIAVWYGYQTINKEDAANGYYTNMGNTNHSRLFQSVAQAIFSEANFEKPSNVVSVTVEKETSPAMLPSEYTPSDLKITELFKAGTEPTEVSNRYSKLSNVTNLKATQNGSKITLTWDKIKTPDAIDEKYLQNYFNKIYTNEGYRASKLQERLNYINNYIGTVGYNIYLKDADGSLKLIDFTKENTYTHELKTTVAKDVTYIVKTCYTVFKDNTSDGTEVKLSIGANTKEIKATLTTESTISLKINDVYKEPTSPIKVTENGTDVTNKATIKIDTITKKSDNSKINSVSDIITTTAEVYEIKYIVTYNNENYTVIKTINIS